MAENVFGGLEEAAPPVIGARSDTPIDEDHEVPERVYLPSERVTRRDADVTLELRDTSEGHRALLVFTSLEALVEGCGDGQPWVQIRGHQIDEVRQRSGAEVVLWDAALPIEERRTRYQQERR